VDRRARRHRDHEPNRAGRTMVWPYYINGRTLIRCFMPGSMT
jgi:hypothetical protein